MLINHIAPPMAKITRAYLRNASRHSILLQSGNKMSTVNKISTSPIGRDLNGISGSPFMLKSHSFTALKAYSTKQPELPSKQELEKYFFKVTVVIWDLAWKITMWSWAMFMKHIINNPTVQSYWKTFNQKLEEARKN